MTIGVQTEDFYTRVVELIENNQVDQAVKMIIGLENLQEQIDVLRKLVEPMMNILARALALDLDRDLDHSLDLALDFARARALALALDGALARSRFPLFVHDLALEGFGTFPGALSGAGALARALARDLELARADARDLELARDLINELTTATTYNRLVLSVLEEINPAPKQASNTETKDYPIKQLDGIGIVTPDVLANQLAPYLQALGNLQHLISELEGRKPPLVRIRLISQNSPPEVGVEGAIQAFSFVEERIVPWRRKHAKTMASLEIAEKELEIEQKRSEIEEARGKAQQMQIDTITAKEEAKLKLEGMRLDVEAKRLEIDKARIELVISLFDKYAANLSEQDRLRFIARLMIQMKILTESPVQIKSDN